LIGLVSGKGWVQPLPGNRHSKHVLRKCQSVRCRADMADTLSASTTSVTMHHTASRALVAEWHIVTCHVFEVRWVWSVAKAEYRHCQSIGPRLAIASCWQAIASSMVILGCSRSLVPAQYHHLRQFNGLSGKSCGQGVSHDLTPSIQCQCFATGQHERCGAGCWSRLAYASWLAFQFNRCW
jgi:hypothetical protein